MRHVLSRVLASMTLFALAGCTAMTTISSAQPDVAIAIKERSYATTPATDTYPTTSFGNYEFKIAKAGGEPFYGILPLKFNGGYLALDILFFAPLAFFNLREVYPFYQVDVEKGVILFKRKEEDEWREFRPTNAEASRARSFFDAEALKSPTPKPGAQSAID